MVSALMAGAVLVAGCPATTVHYGETRIGTPWVAQKRITGHLFAYGGKTLMDSRVNASAGLVLYTRGRGPDDLNTKILWVVRGRFGRVLTLTARRLDATGSFSQRFPAQPRCESTVVGPDGVAATPTSSAIVG